MKCPLNNTKHSAKTSLFASGYASSNGVMTKCFQVNIVASSPSDVTLVVSLYYITCAEVGEFRAGYSVT